MINIGRPETKLEADDWTVVTADGSLSAHFEHTIAVTPAGAVVLTAPAEKGPDRGLVGAAKHV
jgi:methionyl aminopeptidase